MPRRQEDYPNSCLARASSPGLAKKHAPRSLAHLSPGAPQCLPVVQPLSLLLR